MPDSPSRPSVLIEHWLPVQELGIESRRERAASNAMPAIYYLHVWWARRPLMVSRAAILAAALPPDTDHAWFLNTLGVKGDPVGAYRRIQQAAGQRLGDPYGYKRACGYTPDPGTLSDIHRRIADHWGREPLRFLDAMAGGGSIPFEALRYGFETWANELNPVASVILKATLEYPARFGPDLAHDIRRAAEEVHRRAKAELERFYPAQAGEQVSAYVWAHTVQCPGCGLTVPLSPNWWLERAERRIASRPVAQGEAVRFEIVENPEAEGFDPSEGTISRGTGMCPGCREIIEQERLREAARAGDMGYQLVALVVKTSGGREYRPASEADLEAVAAAESSLEDSWRQWAAEGLIPDETVPPMHPKYDPRRYGFNQWFQMFTPRQLLSHLVHVRAIREVGDAIRADMEEDRWRAVMAYLAVILGKCVDYNARLSTWESTRAIVKHVFARHDYSFKWSFGEAVPIGENWPWAVRQVTKAYGELAKLVLSP